MELFEGTLGDENADRRLAAIVESSDDAIIGKTLAGMVTSWNRGAERMFGWSAEEMLGQRVEQALHEKNVELENAVLAKDRFLARLSHELRTPLNAVIGFTGTLLMELPGPLNNEQRRQLETAQTAARNLLSIINDLLDLAKIESGKVELSRQEVSCRALLNDVVGALRPLADAKGLALEAMVPDRDVTVRTNAKVLSQILVNLTSNAIKFTEEGKVELSVVDGELAVTSEYGKGSTFSIRMPTA
ncbi:MAG TPA: histidine kinase dimerization/phospho-acceptor domain-containing protein [Chloroflexota bacterium]|nr:histidine kinase dimerization/phospho-acceptor domain-containing protein [Chloroflexota bacterium]